jgi:hypothetical protein
MNLLRNSDTKVDKKICCGISNFIEKRNPGKTTSTKATTQRVDGRQLKHDNPPKKNGIVVVQKKHCKEKRNRDIGTIPFDEILFERVILNITNSNLIYHNNTNENQNNSLICGIKGG